MGVRVLVGDQDVTEIVGPLHECETCDVVVSGTQWPSHYRTRAHREALTRQRAASEQADTFMSAVGRWTSLHIADADWPLHLLRQADGRWVATIYAPHAQWVSQFVEDPIRDEPNLRGQRLYWRGESYAGLDEALRNAALALQVEGQPEGRA